MRVSVWRPARSQAAERLAVGEAWRDYGLVLAGHDGWVRWPQDVNVALKRLCRLAGIGEDWQPREICHTFVSALSDADVDIEKIADAVGHIRRGWPYQQQRHPHGVPAPDRRCGQRDGSTVMDRLYPAGDDQ